MSRKKTTKDLIGERPTSEELANMPRTPINVILDNVRSLDNVGMIFRLCELARINHLYLTGYTGYPELLNDTRSAQIIERHNNRIAKTAVYALPHQPWSYVEDPVLLVKNLKKLGDQIIALEQTDASIPYNKLSASAYRVPITLILGHERLGIREELIDLADILVEIPILGIGNSHNVATSCGILLYSMLETTKQI
jgi:tRNA G18 (ribose-2'-O)-methylase SpoU